MRSSYGLGVIGMCLIALLWSSGLSASTAAPDMIGQPIKRVGYRMHGVAPRIDRLPYEPKEEPRKSFIVNIFRYVWVVGLFLIGVPVVWRLLAWARNRWRYRAPTACKSCGYDLSRCAEPGCPECGWGRTSGSEAPARGRESMR